MKFTKWSKLTCLIFMLLFLGCAHTTVHQHHVSLENANFVLVTDGYFSRELDFASLPNEQVIYLTYWGDSPTAEFIFSEQRLPIFYQGKTSEEVYLEFENTTKIISFNIQGKPAQYDARYIQQHNNKVTAQIPEVYELTNIILALSDKFHQTHYGMHTEGNYYLKVIEWFAPFKDHELFSTLDEVDYYSLVENGPAYVFHQEQIQTSEIYHGFRAKDAVEEHIVLLEKFAKASDFRAFYKQHQPYYVSLTQRFHTDTQPNNIWKWLESQFPQRYHSYKVFFSPLGAGRHSARMYSQNDFRESVMFISAPNRYENNKDPNWVKAIKLSRSFFTEIDHAYVNPTSDNYIQEINHALPNLSTWYKGGGYNKPYATFNEYMTWSVFLLYAMDTYSAKEYSMIKHYVEDFMQNKRGFYKFEAFNKELTRLYENRPCGHTIVDLYGPIIHWVKNN